MTTLKGYDAWKTRSDLDDAQRYAPPPDRCAFCDAPLDDKPWASWSSDDGQTLFCDQCAERREVER